ncbi:MAG: TetR/AcrR family transcriptional regulator [Wujia sp.]
METKKGVFVSIMRDKIIKESIESLQQEGLKFSVDTLAEKLKVSKKTIYKYFPNKEALALAMYEQYYLEAARQADLIIHEGKDTLYRELLHLYYDSKKMIRGEIFNKYKLNEVIHSYTTKQNDSLWMMISSSFRDTLTDKDKNALRIIIDGTFEKLCNTEMDSELPDSDFIIERLVKLL